MRFWIRLTLAAIGLLLVSNCSRCPEGRAPGPLSPQETIRSFRISDEFRVELFAAEPDVTDPVEIAFDERGRVFVAEMIDYPYDPQPGEAPRSRIRLLEDTDGDGRVDQSTIFAEELVHATSVLPWKGGVLVTAAPDIIFLKDTDGDKRADVREVLFTGFDNTVDSESRITNLRYNIDNWIYASNNGRAGEITFLRRPNASAVSVLGTDFRFRLDRDLFEAASGPTQFGQAINDWGHRFITQNTIHVRHVIMPRRYLTRNLFLAAGRAAQDISDHGRPSVEIFQLTPPQYWRQARTEMRQRRYRQEGLDRLRELNPSTEIASGYITAAAGGTIYSANTFPESYRGNLFTGDVSANLIHRDILRPDGVTYVASRASEEKDREFLASTDPWFRPCNFTVGPDGNLYIVDMYREFVETPASIPEELKKEMDFRSGSDRGRIYRIVPRDAPAAGRERPHLGEADSEELVRLLSHPNGWWRITAQRLLIERQDRSVIPALRRMVLESEAPQGRLHALYALDGLSGLEESLFRTALKDPHPGVREHAVILAERFPKLAGELVVMVNDSSERVIFQLTLSLGEIEDERALRALAEITSRYVTNSWFKSAVLSSKRGSSVDLLAVLAGAGFFGEQSEDKEDFLRQISAAIGARNERREIARWVRLMGRERRFRAERWQAAGLTGLAEGLALARARRLNIPEANAFLGRALGASEEIRTAARRAAVHFEMRALIRASMKEALDADLAPARRQSAIEFLAGGAFDDVRPVFQELLASRPPAEILHAAVRTLALFDEPEVADLLLSHWRTFGPEVRDRVLDALLGHRGRTPHLLDALERKRIETGAFDLPRREKLLRNPDAQISRRAEELFRQEPSDRVEIVRQFQSVLDLQGEPARGRVVFREHCASCHFPQAGKRVGPDLSGVSSKTRDELLHSILDPSRAIDGRYTNYIILAKNGRIYDGLIIGETPGTITLRSGEAEDQTILRSDILEIRASSVSLMPDGFEENMSSQDLADLISFLQGADLR